MKTHSLFIPLFVCSFSFNSISQTYRDSSKSNIGVSIGFGMPLSDFGSTHTDAINSGYASIGYHYDILAEHDISYNKGIMIFIGGNVNPFNTNAYYNSRDFISMYPGGFNITAGNYFIGEYLAGFSFLFPLSNNLILELNTLAGVITVNSPNVTLTYNAAPAYSLPYGGTINYISIPFSIAFAGRLSLGLTQIFSKHWTITYKIAFTDATISYGVYNQDATMAIELFTPTIGLSYSL